MVTTMERRQLITLLGNAAVAGPPSAQCQPTVGIPMIGVLSPISSTPAARNVDALREGFVSLATLKVATSRSSFGLRMEPLNGFLSWPRSWSD